MIFGKHCVFCQKRFKKEHIVWSKNFICICKNCMAEIDAQNTPRIFETTPHLSIIIPSTTYTGIVKSAIHRYKFDNQKQYGNAFSYIIARNIIKYTDFYKYDAVVTVPISGKRLKERGFNQSEIFARTVANVYGIELHNEYLEKFIDTQRQSELNQYERLFNLKGAYAASPEVKDKSIILVDDIYTTGNTMEECAAMLKFAGAKVVAGFTFSATLRKKRPEIYNPFE
jgi:competence protein ComFC